MQEATGHRSRRRRLGAALATGAVIAALGVVGASATTENTTVHACVSTKDGLVRVVADGAACGSKEYATSWNVAGAPGPVGPEGAEGPEGPQGEPGADAVIGPESILSEHLSRGSGTEAVTTAAIRDGAVTDVKITDVAAAKVQGSLDNASLPASALTGLLDGSQVAPAAIDASRLVYASDRGGDPTAPGITGDRIEPNSIGGDRLTAGTVTGRELLANASTGSPSAHLSIPVGAPAGDHLVLVMGQAEVAGVGPGSGTYTYQLVRTHGGATTQVGPSFTVSVGEGERVLLPFSTIDRVGAGAVTYDLQLSAATGENTSAVLGWVTVNAIDLGRAG